VGLDRGLSYDKLREAHQAICKGATFIATNLDAALPDSLTTTAPGGGAVVAALQTSTGVEPILMGKPQTMGFGQIAAAWGVASADMAAVGDRLDTDIAAARTFGCLAILVLTGIATSEQAQQADNECIPDVILNNLSELLPILEQPAASRR
jgi:ribonucleotide monophosphatase NagD (HAD superfamily)